MIIDRALAREREVRYSHRFNVWQNKISSKRESLTLGKYEGTEMGSAMIESSTIASTAPATRDLTPLLRENRVWEKM